MHLIFDTSIIGVHISAFEKMDTETKLLWSGMSLENSRSSVAFPTLLSACLKCTHKTIADVETISVGSGPGSFTGIKVGIAFTQGLSLPQKVKIFPFSTSVEVLSKINRVDGTDLLLLPATKTNGFVFLKSRNKILAGEVSITDSGPVFIAKSTESIKKYYQIDDLIEEIDFAKSKLLVLNSWKLMIAYLGDQKLPFKTISNAEFLECGASEWMQRMNPQSDSVNLNSFEPFYLKKSAPEERVENEMEN